MDDLKAKYLSQIADAADEAALEAIRVAAVGKKGEVALKMRELGKMSPEERQVAGPALNALKDEINSALGGQERRPWPMRRWTSACVRRMAGRHAAVARARGQGTIHPSQSGSWKK